MPNILQKLPSKEVRRAATLRLAAALLLATSVVAGSIHLQAGVIQAASVTADQFNVSTPSPYNDHNDDHGGGNDNQGGGGPGEGNNGDGGNQGGGNGEGNQGGNNDNQGGGNDNQGGNNGGNRGEGGGNQGGGNSGNQGGGNSGGNQGGGNNSDGGSSGKGNEGTGKGKEADPVTEEIPVATGGSVELGGGASESGGATVEVPPSVVADSEHVSVTVSETSKVGPAPEGLQLGQSIEIIMTNDRGDLVRELNAPVSITIRPREDDLAAGSDNIQNLDMGRWNDDGTWTLLDTSHDQVEGTLTARTEHLTKFSVLSALPPKPTLVGPSDGQTILNLAPLLVWINPPSTTQYHLQVTPHNNDGPGIDLYIGDPALVRQGSYEIKAPKLGKGNYLLLPWMTYAWKVRTASITRSLQTSDIGWSSFAVGTFRTPEPDSGAITPVSPLPDGKVDTLTPKITWDNTQDWVFYYEFQLSKDKSFKSDPATATAPIYWEFVHGGKSTPLNSYEIRPQTPLEPNTTYYWRVRPRVQGDREPNSVAWSTTWQFSTPR